MHPLLYELNTRCWLRELSEAHGLPITLANVPEAEFIRWQEFGFTHIWLMGVWTTGPRARAEALKHPGLRTVYHETLPDWTESDVGGSPYAIADYQAPPVLGGEAGLQIFRQILHTHGLRLLLDFVPNHLGVDHPWIIERPELFVQSATPIPDSFQQQTPAGLRWFAHGKDPYFSGWTDTVQLDYRLPATRAAMTELLLSVADRCDGVRCDMAMLVLNDIFDKTWQHIPTRDDQPQIPPSGSLLPIPLGKGPGVRASASAALSQSMGEVSDLRAEFWSSAISTVKEAHRNFLFLAEAYWGLEGRLQALGFDYTYDKVLYDRLVSRDAAGVQQHLLGVSHEFISASAHFLENHDEPRIASILSVPEHRAAALLILGLPGMRFLHEGQGCGARLKTPVQLLRRPAEPPREDSAQIYGQLLTTLPATAVGRGSGKLIRPRPAWPDNPTAQNIIMVQWQAQPPDFDLLVVNLAPFPSQCYAPLTIEGLSAHNWSMKDLLGDQAHTRQGDDLQNQGLYLDLPAHGAQLFHFAPC